MLYDKIIFIVKNEYLYDDYMDFHALNLPFPNCTCFRRELILYNAIM